MNWVELEPTNVGTSYGNTFEQNLGTLEYTNIIAAATDELNAAEHLTEATVILGNCWGLELNSAGL